ncbi:hypothetical protein C6Y44_20595 [Rhodococcus rhodochrous]|nr:hypothetical protein C6Y44_20595 [Rhodococcus rhodochrous]
MRIEYVDVDESMIMSAGALESTIDRLGVAPVLHSETFGARTPPALEKILNSIEQSGTPVIADETHSILQSRPSSFTYRIASLRKLLPLPDGAYVFGLDYMQPDREQGGLSEVVGLRLTAAEQKAAYLRGDRNDKAFLDIYARAENILDEFSDILPMSRQSEVLLASLDYESLSRRRESNATYLAAGLDDISSIRIVNREAVTTAPPYLVVSSDRVLELRTHLTAQGVYCPIHWPPPKESELRRRWKSPVLSMPIDHRYNHRDMQRIIDLIVEFERGRRVSR